MNFCSPRSGPEANGSPLTILSALSRLGRDPWAEAAGWTKLPPASIIDRLADCISQMPLRPPALAEARTTAARLILLLPAPAQAQAQPFRKGERMANGNSTTPRWVPISPKPPDKPTTVWINPPQIKAAQLSLN